MFSKLSEIADKDEYEKIIKDYNNNYGYNIGFNGYTNIEKKDSEDNSLKDLLIMEKR